MLINTWIVVLLRNTSHFLISPFFARDEHFYNVIDCFKKQMKF